MLKISSKSSVTLSIILSIVFMIILIGGAVIMPWLSEVLINLDDTVGNHNEINQFGRYGILIMAYMILTCMAAADVLLMKLLFRVRDGLVFTAESVGLIRGVSWCAILLGCVFAALGFHFQLSLFAAFACIFLGLCLRVVKNVIEQATEIKSENDFTI